MSANKERGEVDITVTRTVNGEDVEKTYTLKLGMNACVALETKLKKPMKAIFDEASTMNFTVIREIVSALLQKHHAKEFPTVEKVGDLIDDAGGIVVFFGKLAELANDQTAADGATGDDTADPSHAQIGIGDDSTPALVGSV